MLWFCTNGKSPRQQASFDEIFVEFAKTELAMDCEVAHYKIKPLLVSGLIHSDSCREDLGLPCC